MQLYIILYTYIHNLSSVDNIIIKGETGIAGGRKNLIAYAKVKQYISKA